MAVKKLMFCVLCLANAANLATEEDFNDENSSNSKVEENILINKNTWNTRKWGSIYIFISHFIITNSWIKFGEQYSFLGLLKNKWEIFFNWVVSGGVEYKYIFHKKWGINIRLNLNNAERIAFLIKNVCFKKNDEKYYQKYYPLYSPEKYKEYPLKEEMNHFPPYIFTEIGYAFFSLEFAFERIWRRKSVMGTNNEKIEIVYSSSFSPIGFAFYVINFDSRDSIDYKERFIFTGTFIPLKMEFSKASFINFGKIKFNWHTLLYLCEKEAFKNFLFDLLLNFFSLEIGINVINNECYQKKLNEEIEN